MVKTYVSVDGFTLRCERNDCCRHGAALVRFDVYVSDVFTLLCGYVCCRYWAAVVSFASIVIRFDAPATASFVVLLRLLPISPWITLWSLTIWL